jgi:hypothetical protein
MAFLASILAQREDEPMDPITDSTDCLAAFTRLPAHQTNGVVAATDSIRMAFLNDILPAPVGRIEPADLANFKSSHEKLLLGFRNEIENGSLPRRRSTTPDYRHDSLNLSVPETRFELP